MFTPEQEREYEERCARVVEKIQQTVCQRIALAYELEEQAQQLRQSINVLEHSVSKESWWNIDFLEREDISAMCDVSPVGLDREINWSGIEE